MFRLFGFALLLVIVVPAIFGFAASFNVDPIVNQEFTIPVEDVTTTTEGGPTLVEKTTIDSTSPNFVTVLDSDPVAEPAGCTDAELAAGYLKCLDGTFDTKDTPKEEPTATPTATPTPIPHTDGKPTPTNTPEVYWAH